jgi:formylglycine-generating enzyme required for sulfatase activity
VVSTQQPIVSVTWAQAVEFCRWLRLKTGRPYRLPSEAEWEYACRAGSATAYCSGDDAAKLGDYAWFEDSADERIHCVKLKKPNAWGLYDMHGNALEWCHDLYDPMAYTARAQAGGTRNPFGPSGRAVPDLGAPASVGKFSHVARGGTYEDLPKKLRSAARDHEEPFWRYEDPQEPKNWWWLTGFGKVGFRVACDAAKR